MSGIDKENMQALREIRNAGRAIELATKRMIEQREIRREAKDKFAMLLMTYPHAREIYYYGKIRTKEDK